jgi:hypothetical protein
MNLADEILRVHRRSWGATLASLLPLWLLSLSITAEGFPHPPIPAGLAFAAFVCALASGLVLLWLRWMTFELTLYSLIPITFLFTLDEISTGYKTPFIILCGLLLTAGGIGYQHSHPLWLRWLILLVGAALALTVASFMGDRYWILVSQGGFDACYPGCVPPMDAAHPWWGVFFLVK